MTEARLVLREELLLRWLTKRLERRFSPRADRGGDGPDTDSTPEETDGERDARRKSPKLKLRRGEAEADADALSGESCWWSGVVVDAPSGGVMISWEMVSERMNLNSGVGGVTGRGCGSWGLLLALSSSRLWRMFLREGMVVMIIDNYCDKEGWSVVGVGRGWLVRLERC